MLENDELLKNKCFLSKVKCGHLKLELTKNLHINLIIFKDILVKNKSKFEIIISTDH